MDERLKIIKELNDEANSLANSDGYDDIERVQDILNELFFKEHTDYLIQTIEQQQKRIKILERIYKSDVPYFMDESKEKSKQLQEKDVEIERYKNYINQVNYDSEQTAIKNVYLNMEIERLKKLL